MKTKSILRLCTVAVATIILATGCSDAFLEEKKDYSKVSPEIWENYAGCVARINNIYTVVLPVYNGESNLLYYPSSGGSDLFSASTEEFTGLTDFVDPGKILDYSNIQDLFYYSRKTSEGTYGRIRNCNDAIEGLTASTGITDAQKAELLGQAYFFRAWLYYRIVKVYGGVPIVATVQDPISSNKEANIPRSSTKDCIGFICSDLQKAASYLPFKWDAGNFGRVTSGTALALMGRVRLLYASPLFNRTDDKTRWEQAYQVNKNALDTLAAGDFGLAYLDKPGVNASGWAKLFSDYNSTEAVFVTLYNNVSDDGGSTSPYKNNGWENGIRPSNANGGSGKTASAMLVDMFPMADGGISTYCNTIGTYTKLELSELTYNPAIPFLNRDPRFYRTFAFPGVKWQFKGDLSDRTKFNINSYPYDNGSKYELWNYAWYTDVERRDDITKSGYAADGLVDSYKGVYIRKKSDDLQVNNSPLYNFDATKKFGLSAAPYMEIRYAEVLLNFAEAACGAGHYDEAIDALVAIRKRVGYTEGNNYYGLGNLNGITDRATLFSAILYERQIELAYEGKRFDDMRRWMLFDGGIGQATLKQTWALSGFNGNTCSYLGVKPFNGQRRDNLEFRVSNSISNGISASTTSDPLKSITRPAALDLSLNLSSQIDGLKDFYTANLVRKTRQGDEVDKYVTFKPEYYFIGFRSSALQNNSAVEQNIGWASYASGGAVGTFDPLAE